METDLKIAIDKYCEKFNEPFPIVLTRYKDDDEILELINDSLEKNQPIKIVYDDDLDY
ncbi:MAG: hypothetical protein Q7K36_07320 [Fusobacterium sp. JB020]|nr:hypothetical protein [Fusobacterium sp. JB020]